MNPVSMNITGWGEKEAMGKNLNEVFNITQEGSGAPIDNPVRRVIDSNQIK